MRRARRLAALLVVAVLFAPGVCGAVALLHLSSRQAAEPHEDHHDHAADLSALWHGHTHETTTPDHDHPLLLAGTLFRIPTVDQPAQSVPGPWQHAAFAIAAKERGSRLIPRGLAGVGPPLCLERLSTLRI